MIRATRPKCPQPCPNRKPGCQNRETCPIWDEFCAAKDAEAAAYFAANRREGDYQAVREGSKKRRTYRHGPQK